MEKDDLSGIIGKSDIDYKVLKRHFGKGADNVHEVARIELSDIPNTEEFQKLREKFSLNDPFGSGASLGDYVCFILYRQDTPKDERKDCLNSDYLLRIDTKKRGNVGAMISIQDNPDFAGAYRHMIEWATKYMPKGQNNDTKQTEE